MLKLISKIFPSKHVKDYKASLPVVEEINAYFEEYKNFTDDQLRAKTQELKQRIKDNIAESEIKITELREKLKESEESKKLSPLKFLIISKILTILNMMEDSNSLQDQEKL